MSRETQAGDSATLSGSVYKQIRTDIISGRLAPGEQLRLEALRRHYGVSLSPVREALLRLASDTFVDAVENRGYRVAEISREDLQDITEARVLIEREALRKSIAQGDEAWEAAIVAAHYRLTKSDARVDTLAPGDLEEWEQANRTFHDALVAAAGSHWLGRFRRLLQDQSRRYRLLSLQRSASHRAVQAEHDALMEATLARDTPRAIALIDQHIRATAEVILGELRPQEPDPPTR